MTWAIAVDTCRQISASPDTLFLHGTGGTIHANAYGLGSTKTLFGIDALRVRVAGGHVWRPCTQRASFSRARILRGRALRECPHAPAEISMGRPSARHSGNPSSRRRAWNPLLRISATASNAKTQ